MDELYVDDAVDFLEEVPANVVRRVLANTDHETREIINRFLEYPDNSAGSVMTIEMVELHDRLTVGEAIDGYINAKEAVLSPKTIREYRGMFRNYYDPIKKKSIRKLTNEDLQLYVSSLVGTVSAKTISNIYYIFFHNVNSLNC